MAQQVMKSYASFLGIYDISGDFAKVDAEISAPSVEATPMSSTSRGYIGGIMEGNIDYDGFWSEGTGLVSDVLNTYQSSGAQLICYAFSTPLTGSFGGGFATVLPNLSIVRTEEV